MEDGEETTNADAVRRFGPAFKLELVDKGMDTCWGRSGS